jgi:hypothetical protein
MTTRMFTSTSQPYRASRAKASAATTSGLGRLIPAKDGARRATRRAPLGQAADRRRARPYLRVSDLSAVGNRPIESIKRSDIVRLLEDIAEQHGPHRAQAALAILSKRFNWHTSRDDDFLSPVRRGMTRVKPQDYARTGC